MNPISRAILCSLLVSVIALGAGGCAVSSGPKEPVMIKYGMCAINWDKIPSGRYDKETIGSLLPSVHRIAMFDAAAGIPASEFQRVWSKMPETDSRRKFFAQFPSDYRFTDSHFLTQLDALAYRCGWTDLYLVKFNRDSSVAEVIASSAASSRNLFRYAKPGDVIVGATGF